MVSGERGATPFEDVHVIKEASIPLDRDVVEKCALVQGVRSTRRAMLRKVLAAELDRLSRKANVAREQLARIR